MLRTMVVYIEETLSAHIEGVIELIPTSSYAFSF